MHLKSLIGICIALCCCSTASAQSTVRNDAYELTLLKDHNIQVAVAGVPPQILSPRFTVMFSEKDPGYHRNHQNYLLAPRTAIRWPNYQEDIAPLNEWLKTADALASTGAQGVVSDDGKGGRTWEYKDDKGRMVQKVSGMYALGTVNPFQVGKAIELKASGATVAGNTIRWTFATNAPVKLSAEVTLPSGDADPSITWKLTVASDGFYSIIYTGAPQESAEAVIQISQECAGRNFRQWNFVVCEGDLKLPRAHVAAKTYNSALVIDAKEGPFRLVDDDNSRFGLMLERREGKVRPMSLAPLMGGPESKMNAGATHAFTSRYVLKGGDWKDTYRHIARKLYNFRDQHDNSGPGSINTALENCIDYIVDRNGKNHAMWHDEQKYFDYWSDKSGVFKPFSPLYGLSAAIITDDEDFYRRRARPAVEFAISRTDNVFSPYDLFDNKMISKQNRGLGFPYPPLPQIVSLDRFFQGRTYALGNYAREAKPEKNNLVDALAIYRMTGDPKDLQTARQLADAALKRPAASGPIYMDWLEIYEATKDKRYLAQAVERCYDALWEFNISPAVPDEHVTMDTGGKVPIHVHSHGRHKAWGFPPPESYPYKQQTVPAWRPAVTGIISDAYRAGFWMHHHGQFMRMAALSEDDFLRDMARWGWVGRFGNYNGDNRSSHSLIVESPNAIENPIWKLTYSTINPGHAWEFVGEMLDFIISDAFHRSGQKIDFPAESMHGTSFQVKTYGARAGRFYDDENVRLWMPRKLLAIDNKQFDYLAGYGDGKLYLAIWSQSFKEETATVAINPELANLTGKHATRKWTDNAAATAQSLDGNQIKITVPPKGIVAFAIDGVAIKTQLSAKMFGSTAPKLGPSSFIRVDAPFGKVHGMLLSMGKGLTNAFVYTDALPENVIEAKIRYRQGTSEWHEVRDAIFPFEFSLDYDESKPPLEFVLEVENAEQQLQTSSPLVLKP